MTPEELQKAKSWNSMLALIWLIGCALFVFSVWSQMGWKSGIGAVGLALCGTAAADKSYSKN